MKLILAFLNYILFGNIFIAICAVMLCIHTSLISDIALNTSFLLFIFCSTISSYNLHAYFNSLPIAHSVRVEWVRKNRRTLLISFVFASIDVFISIFWMVQMIKWVIVLAIFTILYSSPRILSKPGNFLKLIQSYKVFYLALIWTVVTVLLPVIYADVKMDKEMAIFFANRYLFILQICLLFDYRDRYLLKPGDRQSILKYFDGRQFNFLFLIAGLGVLITSGILLLQGSDMKGFSSMLVAEIFTILLFRKSLESHSDYWYNLVVDGLLLIPGIAFLLMKI